MNPGIAEGLKRALKMVDRPHAHWGSNSIRIKKSFENTSDPVLSFLLRDQMCFQDIVL